MLFLDTNEIEQLEEDVYSDASSIRTIEATDQEISRLTAIKEKISQTKLLEEIKQIATDYSQSPYKETGFFKKNIAVFKAKKRLNLAQERYNRAMSLITEINALIDDLLFFKDYLKSMGYGTDKVNCSKPETKGKQEVLASTASSHEL